MGVYGNIALSGLRTTYLVWIGVLSLLFRCALGTTCSTYNSNRQKLDTFNCPKRGGDQEDSYCCGPSMKQKCCDYEDYLEENQDLSGAVVAVIVILTMLFFGCVIFAFCCLCSCCYLAQRRQRRGLVLTSGITPTTLITTTTTANQPGSAGYPRQTYYQPVAHTNAAPPNTGSYPYQNQPTSNIYPPAAHMEYEKPPPYYEN